MSKGGGGGGKNLGTTIPDRKLLGAQEWQNVKIVVGKGGGEQNRCQWQSNVERSVKRDNRGLRIKSRAFDREISTSRNIARNQRCGRTDSFTSLKSCTEPLQGSREKRFSGKKMRRQIGGVASWSETTSVRLGVDSRKERAGGRERDPP